LGPVALGAMTCPTVDDALRWLVSAMPIVNESAQTRYADGTFYEGPSHGRSMWSRSMAEATMAVIFTFLQRWTRAKIPPLRAGFQHDHPSRTSELESFFRCPVVFRQPTNFTTYAPETLALTLTYAEPALHSFIATAATRELSELHKDRSFGSRLTEVLL